MDEVAVIILNWNQYDITRDCIKSVLLSENVRIYIILVDNGSHDDSSQKLSREFPNIDLVKVEINQGYSKGCNIGLMHALNYYNDKYIVFISNDTVLDSHCIYYLTLSSKKTANIGLVVPKIYFYDKPSILWYAGGVMNKFLVKGKHFGFRKLDSVKFSIEKEVTFGNGCLFLVTPAVLKNIGYLDTSFVSYAEDVDFSIRIGLKGFKIIYAPRSIVWHRISFSTSEVKSISKIVYYSLRNTIWLQKKYPNELSAVGLLINICFQVFKYLFRSFLKGDWATLKILYKAIKDGYKYKCDIINAK